MSLPAVLSSQSLYYVSWEITHLCDAECVHCYACAGPGVDTAGELSTGEALGVIDQLVAAGRPMLALSGGEPLTRPDWWQLVRYAVAREIVVTIVTNGSSIGEDEARELRELGVESVTVSLDSHRPEVHDDLRRLAGLHARATAAIRRLAAAGVRVVVNFTPTTRTWRDLRGVVTLADELGADAVSLSEYVVVGRGTPELGLTPDETSRLVDEWNALRETYRGRFTLAADARTVAMLGTGSRAAGCPDCGAGRDAVRICPDGTVTPCAFLPLPVGSFRQETFAELWPRTRWVQEARERAGGGAANCATCGMLVASRQAASD